MVGGRLSPCAHVHLTSRDVKVKTKLLLLVATRPI